MTWLNKREERRLVKKDRDSQTKTSSQKGIREPQTRGAFEGESFRSALHLQAREVRALFFEQSITKPKDKGKRDI